MTWAPLPPKQVKFNIDYASKHGSNVANCRGICWDNNGSWITGFICNLGSYSVFVAES